MDKIRAIYRVLEDKKGENITILKIEELTTLADYMIIVTAKNENHLRTMSEELFYKLKDEGIAPLHKEGTPQSEWILMDYGDVLVNIMSAEKRLYYNLEELWFEAPKIEIS